MLTRKGLQRWSLVVVTLTFIFAVMPAVAAPLTQEYDMAVMPAELNRLSWGAVLAGAIIALVLQLALNLLGVGIGITTLTADPHDPDDEAASFDDAAKSALLWMGFTTLVSLFIGGWLAARMAGIPDGTDGMVHGLMVWGIVMIVTLILITTTFGRLFNGLTNMIGQAMSILTRLTGAAAQTAANVAGTAVQGAANVVSGAGAAVANTVRGAAETAQPAVEQAREQVEQRVREELDKNPDLRRALNSQTAARQRIEEEVRKLLSEAGLDPARVEAEVEDAAVDVRRAAEEAAGKAVQDPRGALDTIMAALSNVLERGSAVINDVDRDSVVSILTARTGQTEEQARATLSQWENQLNEARGETERIRTEAESQIRRVQREAEQRIKQMRTDIEEKVEDVRQEVDLKAREAASAATKTISRIALAAFAAIVVGGIAAGLGGAVGAPEQLPIAEVVFDETPTVIPTIQVDGTPTPFPTTEANATASPELFPTSTDVPLP